MSERSGKRLGCAEIGVTVSDKVYEIGEGLTIGVGAAAGEGTAALYERVG